MKLAIKVLLAFLFAAFFSCRDTSTSEQSVEKVISDLTDRFSQLPKGKSKLTDYYKLVRSVRRGETNFEIQLFSAPYTIEDPQQILILINSSGKQYAIPFFSNTYADYWDFEFDSPVSTIKPTNTTFAKELMTALDTLHLNDTIGTGYDVVNEMLISLLHCVQVTESDSARLLRLPMRVNNNIPQESSDSGFARIRKNYQAISSQWRPEEVNCNYNSYWDKSNDRIYQFNNIEKGWRKKLELSIKIYRQDCVYHSITL